MNYQLFAPRQLPSSIPHKRQLTPFLVKNRSTLWVWGMPIEDRREPVHGGLTAAPCRRHPR